MVGTGSSAQKRHEKAAIFAFLRATCVLGRRVLLLLVLLHEKGVRAGYMMCCAGSSRPQGERMRATIKQPRRLHEGWGMHMRSLFEKHPRATALQHEPWRHPTHPTGHTLL